MRSISSVFLRKLALLTLLVVAAHVHAGACRGTGVELQVLGSGGPELSDARAASSYLIRQDGRARVLVDIGGGSAQRFGESGARMEDLDLILLTHLHVDHSGDLPALVKSSYFQARTRPLPVLGPGGGGRFPSTTEFLNRLFGPAGAYAYLSDYLPIDKNSSIGSYALQTRDVEPPSASVATVFEADGLKVSAVTLVHGIVPALGWRVEVGGASLAFSGDTDGNNGALERLAKGVDLLVAHNAVPEGATGAAVALHMPPSVIGRIARDAAIGSLVLSHRMTRTSGREDETAKEISRAYRGGIDFADDLDCFRVIASGPSATRTPASATPGNFADEWLGQWNGPEGTSLLLSKGGDQYVIQIQSLDGSATYNGVAVGDRIEFKRDGEAQSIRMGSGKETGMKWLAEKKVCLIIEEGEGFCRE